MGKCFYVFFILSIFNSFSQVFLEGVVKDSTATLLANTNIIAKPKDVTKNMRFAITDEAGRYRLQLIKNETYTITVSYLGYKNQVFTFHVKENLKKNFTLTEEENQLKEVIIELPVTVKEDTIIYNTSKFINGKERKLKNILKKLPGVEVDKEGSVTVQGKKVTKLLVDGKPFFGGGTKLGVENIPADAVDKVEVLDNYNEVAFLKGLSDSDEMAMNITLKEDKKRFVFGDVEAGKGNKKFYKAKATLFYYSPKTNVNFIGNSNTIGEKTFTFKDYLDFEGGVNAVFKRGFNFKGGDLSQFFKSTDILKSNQQFGALNITKTTSSKLDVSGYAIFSRTNTNSFQINENQYVDFIENQEDNTNSKNILGIGKLTFDYSPNTKEQWYFKTQVKRTNNNKLNLFSSIINLNENNIHTNNSGVATYVNQNIEWHHDYSRKHTFSAIANYIFDKNNFENLWETSYPILEGLIPLDETQEALIIKQNKQTEHHYFNTVFKDFWVLNRNNHIYTTIGNTYQEEFFNTNDRQLLDDGTENSFIANSFNNQIKYNHHDFFVGLHYKFRTGIFTFKQGAYAHRYDWNVNQDSDLNIKKWVVLPDFLAKIEFNKSKKIELTYNLKTDFAEVNKLANRFYLASYNSVFRGNENLENELYHSARIRYSRFSMYRGLLLNASLNYTKKVKGYQNTVNFQGINQFITYQLVNNAQESFNVRGSIKKRIDKIRYKAKVNYKKANYNQLINNLFVENLNENYSYDVGLEMLFDKYPSIELGYKQTIGNYTTSSASSKFISNEPYANLEYDFLKGFKVEADYIFYNYQNKTTNLENSYQVSNAILQYQKEDSPWGFKLTGQNLFNTQFKQSNSFSDYLISDSKTYIMPRAIVFSIGYKL